MSREELLSPAADPIERAEETTLRPRRLDEFVGQERLKEHLEILLGAARQRGQAVDHLLFAGPPGTGKTSLAGIVAAELGVSLRVTSGPALERAGDLAAILTNLDDGDVLFIDEVHRLPRAVEEVLYPAMEDFQLDIVIGKGPSARSIRLDLPRFTLAGATTRTGLITGPLRDRFGLVSRLDYYEAEDLVTILERAAGILGVPLESEGAREIAGRARGTPRVANRLLKRVRDYAEVRGDGTVSAATARAALALFEVDERGLDKVDRSILTALCETFAGQPVGLSTLAVAVTEESETVEDVYEPFLLKEGLLQRTPRGPRRDGGRVRAPRARRAGRDRRRPEPLRALNGPSRPSGGNRVPLASIFGSGSTRNPHSMPVALLYLGILVAAFLLLIVRPQRRQMAAHRALVASLQVGDEVVTSGGIYGTIRGLDDGTVDLEVSPGIVLRVARGAIGQRVEPDVETDEIGPPDDDPGDGGSQSPRREP